MGRPQWRRLLGSVLRYEHSVVELQMEGDLGGEGMHFTEKMTVFS